MTANHSARARAGIEQQQKAADPASSVWVSASAGSGKTRVLVDRTLRLMLSGTRPEKILCITFTKAAAAEMSNRLNKTLGAWSVMGNEDLLKTLTVLIGRPPTEDEYIRARRLFANVLDAPGGLKIQTIHSFCESILGRFPLEAGIAPNFDVMDERTAAEIMETARDHLLAGSQRFGYEELAIALALISRQVNEKDFSDLMRSLSARRGRMKRFMGHHKGLEGALKYLGEFIGADRSETEHDILEQACRENAFDGPALRQATEILLEGSKRDQENGRKLEDWLRLTEQRLSLMPAYWSAFFTAKNDVKKPGTLATETSAKKMPNIRDVLLAEADRLTAVRDHQNRIRVLANSSALLQLGQQLVADYDAEKKRRGKLDYDDLILTTRDLLTAPDVAPWVMFKLDGGIDHILVDEAQDTSPEQWEVVGALAEEFFTGGSARDETRTLFVVGDEKQSIYSFQGADPAAFDKMRGLFELKAEAAQKAWTRVPLDLSFRSTDAVLGLVDDIFAPMEARAGLTADVSEIQHFIFREQQAGFTEIWPTVKHPDHDEQDPWEIPVDQGLNTSPAAQLGKNIATQIKTWLTEGERLESDGRIIRPKDVMILVQSRNSFFENMVRALKKADIPVAGADRMILNEQLAVMDLIALAKFALLPDDDLNLAIVLKGPFVGCDDQQLFTLAYKRPGSLWGALRDNKPGLAIFEAATGFLRSLLARADFVPVYEFFAEILGRQRGREKLLRRLGEEAADPIDEFLSLALSYQRTEATSLQAFLHWVEAGGAEVKRDMEQGRDEVRVLTVHGSKGLQAPIVFLPDTCQTSRAAGGTTIFWSDETVPTPLWPAKTINDEARSKAARAKIKERQQEEKRRLLYVALTRAEDRLYICGWEGKRTRAQGCWYDLINAAFGEDHAHKLEEVSLPWGDVARRRSAGVPVEPKESEASDVVREKMLALPQWAKQAPAAEPFPPQPLTPSREEEEPPVRSPLGGDDGHRYHRGIIIHRLLESLPSIKEGGREDAAKKWLARPAHALSEEQQAQILAETLRVLRDPQFARIFGPDSMAEVPLTGLFGDQIMSGQIDRLLIGDEEILIVDYKTNRPSPAEINNVPAIYIRQMKIYRQALSRMYPEKPIKCGLLWTDGPHLMIIPEE